MTSNRAKRPKLERDRPVRTWQALFGGAPAAGVRAAPRPGGGPEQPGNASASEPSPAAPALSDTVELGYRVIDEYLKQGQQAAQAFNPTTWPGGAAGAAGAATNDLPQMAQRVMQYGWDFAGLWFEMWNRMAASNGGAPFSPMPGPPGGPFAPNGSHPASSTPTAPAPPAGEAMPAESPMRLVVSVACDRPTTTSVELRPGSNARLHVHALRPEDHDGPAIRDVKIEPKSDDGTVTIGVTIPVAAKAGIYNAMIIDPDTNLPRGTLSVRVLPEKD